MAILAYFDASGDANQRALSVCGFIARPDDWQRFDVSWRRVLDSERVPELHMKIFAHSVGCFAPWKADEPRRVGFLKQLIEVTKSNVLKPVLVSLLVDDYNRVNRTYMLREALGGPYAITALMAIITAREWSQANHPDEPISFVFESGDNDQGELLTTLNRIKATDQLTVTFMPKQWKDENGTVQYHYPFQACDLLAYESAKAWRMHLAEEDRQGKFLDELHNARHPLRAFMPKQRDPTSMYADAHLLLAYCRRLGVRRRQWSQA